MRILLLLVISLCIISILTITSCCKEHNSVDETVTIETAINSSSLDSNSPPTSNATDHDKTIADLITKIENMRDAITRIGYMQNEINLLKDQINTQNVQDYGPVIDAFQKRSDDIFLSMEKDNNYLYALHVKVPKEEFVSYRFYLLTGYEIDGVIVLNRFVVPQYDLSDNPEKIDVDTDKYELYKLMLSKIEYDGTSVLLVIAIDNKNNEYTYFRHSDLFGSDI